MDSHDIFWRSKLRKSTLFQNTKAVWHCALNSSHDVMSRMCQVFCVHSCVILWPWIYSHAPSSQEKTCKQLLPCLLWRIPAWLCVVMTDRNVRRSTDSISVCRTASSFGFCRRIFLWHQLCLCPWNVFRFFWQSSVANLHLFVSLSTVTGMLSSEGNLSKVLRSFSKVGKSCLMLNWTLIQLGSGAGKRLTTSGRNKFHWAYFLRPRDSLESELALAGWVCAVGCTGELTVQRGSLFWMSGVNCADVTWKKLMTGEKDDTWQRKDDGLKTDFRHACLVAVCGHEPGQWHFTCETSGLRGALFAKNKKWRIFNALIHCFVRFIHWEQTGCFEKNENWSGRKYSWCHRTWRLSFDQSQNESQDRNALTVACVWPGFLSGVILSHLHETREGKEKAVFSPSLELPCQMSIAALFGKMLRGLQSDSPLGSMPWSIQITAQYCHLPCIPIFSWNWRLKHAWYAGIQIFETVHISFQTSSKSPARFTRCPQDSKGEQFAQQCFSRALVFVQKVRWSRIAYFFWIDEKQIACPRAAHTLRVVKFVPTPNKKKSLNSGCFTL